MGEVFVSSHALKHGLSELEILQAWCNPLSSMRRSAPNEEARVAIGVTAFGKLVQLVGIDTVRGTLIIHAMCPPTQKVLKELNLM